MPVMPRIASSGPGVGTGGSMLAMPEVSPAWLGGHRATTFEPAATPLSNWASLLPSRTNLPLRLEVKMRRLIRACEDGVPIVATLWPSWSSANVNWFGGRPPRLALCMGTTIWSKRVWPASHMPRELTPAADWKLPSFRNAKRWPLQPGSSKVDW